jgi:hypothetical protein
MKVRVHLDIHPNAKAPLQAWFATIPRFERPNVRAGLKSFVQKEAYKSVSPEKGAGYFNWQYGGANIRYYVRWMKKKYFLYWTRAYVLVKIVSVTPIS